MTEPFDATVLLVDDDADVREGLGRLLRSAGWKTRAFATASEFLAEQPYDHDGCIVLDVLMPGMSGPELHNWLREHDASMPVIFLSGNGDVPMSVREMKKGAFDFLEKPADADIFLETVNSAVERHHLERLRRAANDEVSTRLASLSAREREVMGHVVAGRLNKQIASDLHISEKTVKVHRGRAMAKMKVRSLAQLVYLCDQIGFGRPALAAATRVS